MRVTTGRIEASLSQIAARTLVGRILVARAIVVGPRILGWGKIGATRVDGAPWISTIRKYRTRLFDRAGPSPKRQSHFSEAAPASVSYALGTRFLALGTKHLVLRRRTKFSHDHAHIVRQRDPSR